MGAIAISDPLKVDAIQTIKQLQRKKINVAMVTGDNPATAHAVASQLAISTVLASATPQQKMDYVQQRQAAGEIVAMVGDGINDAAALAQADVGIAIGQGTDVAIASAAVILLTPKLDKVIMTIHWSKIVMRNIKQNLVAACIYNCLGIPIAAGALYPWRGILLNPIVAGVAMALSSLCVVGNAIRLNLIRL